MTRETSQQEERSLNITHALIHNIQICKQKLNILTDETERERERETYAASGQFLIFFDHAGLSIESKLDEPSSLFFFFR